MTEFEYGFIADGGPVISTAFGFLPHKSAASAKHTGVKWYWDTLEIVRRVPGTETWETVPEDDPSWDAFDD